MKRFEFNIVSRMSFFERLEQFVGFKINNENTNSVYSLIDNLNSINKLGVLSLNEHIDLSETFEEFITGIYLNEEYNNLHQFIARLTINDLNEFFEDYNFNNKNVKLYKDQIYKETVLDLLTGYYSSICNLKLQFSFHNTRAIIENENKALKNHDFRLIAPLVIPHHEWQELIKSELEKENSIKEMTNLILSINNSLNSLFLKLYDANVPFFPIEQPEFFINSWLENSDLLIYPFADSLHLKEDFLKTFNLKKLQSIYNKSLKSRYDKTKKQKLFLESKLRKGKFEIKSAKHYLMILKGFTYLLKKQNSKIKIEDNTAEKLTHNLFHTKGSNFSTTEIKTNVKINNKILLEYLIFLIRDKGFIKCDLNKIPLIVSKNINYKAKGFSYKNLYKLFNEIICENELTFKGVTSVRALNNGHCLINCVSFKKLRIN